MNRNVPRNQEETTRTLAAVIGGALLGVAVGGPVGAVVGGAVGLIAGQKTNNSLRKKNGHDRPSEKTKF
ncbi:MAG: hypothetical protein ACR2NQ_00930 [Thermodesulfobacteriota bacterium]